MMNRKNWSKPMVSQLSRNNVKGGTTTAMYRGENYAIASGTAGATCPITCYTTVVAYPTGVNGTGVYCNFGSQAPVLPMCS